MKTRDIYKEWQTREFGEEPTEISLSEEEAIELGLLDSGKKPARS